MNSKEQQLEEISQKVNNYKPLKQPPIYEMFITMISMAMTIMLFLFTGMLAEGAHGITSLYGILLLVMPQWMWAFSFLISGMLKAVGMLIENKSMRVVGLIMSALIYAVFAISYAVSFPNIGSIVFTAITVFSLLSVPEVKRTGLKE